MKNYVLFVIDENKMPNILGVFDSEEKMLQASDSFMLYSEEHGLNYNEIHAKECNFNELEYNEQVIEIIEDIYGKH